MNGRAKGFVAKWSSTVEVALLQALEQA